MKFSNKNEFCEYAEKNIYGVEYYGIKNKHTGVSVVPAIYNAVDVFSNEEIYGYKHHDDFHAYLYSSSGELIKSFPAEEVCKKYGHDWDSGHANGSYLDYRCKRCYESDKIERDF